MNEVVLYDNSVDFAVGAWLHKCYGRSHSDKTRTVYERTITQFRNLLRQTNCELDGPTRNVALVLQAFASGSAEGQGLSAASHNQRIAVVSSFYRYCQRSGLLESDGQPRANPAERVERRPEQPYRNATALHVEDVRTRLSELGREGLAGKRDYALLVVALTTGRRLSEIIRMRLSDFDGDVVTFETKGGKVMRDRLTPTVMSALKEYMTSLWEADYKTEAGIWLSLARNGSHGKPLSVRAAEDICLRRLGTSRFHALRHTFAHLMEDAGAKTSDIQARLGHSNIATTGRYLASLRSDENKFADTLVAQLGL